MKHIERLNKHIADGTLIRKAWVGTDHLGRETACLLAAMVPRCGLEESTLACPAEVMPSWLAHLTPRLDDNGSPEAWPAMIKRFASLAASWHRLDADAWQRVQYTFLAAAVREAASHTKEPAVTAVCERVTAVCERVAALCDGVAITGVINAASFQKERARAAKAAAWAWAAAEAAEEAEEAAAAWAAAAWAAAADAAAAAAAWAAAADAAAWAAEAEEEAAAAAAAAAKAAAKAAARAADAAKAKAEAEAAWDRMTIVLFDAIEKELSGAANQ